MNKQTITSICSIAALSAALISSAYAGLVVTSTSLDVNFNDAADISDDTAFQMHSFTNGGAWNNYLVHNPTGGIAGDGALNFNNNYRSLNWKQSLTGGVGTVITQSLVFTANNLVNTNGQAVPFMLGFLNGGSHIANPTTGPGASATADAFQLQLYHNPTQNFISTTLRSMVDGANGEQAYANFAYTGTNMLQFDLTLTRTGTDTFDWGYVVTDLGADGAGSSLMGSNTQSITVADLGASMDGGGIYAGMRSGDQNGGLISGLDQWSVNVVPEPSAYALLAGALALGLVMIRRRRS